MIDAIRIMNQIYNDFNCYNEYAKWYVPYKMHLIAWAWDFVPDYLREQYYNASKLLFVEGDINYFSDDNVWSYFEMPNRTYRERIIKMLNRSYKQAVSKKKSTKQIAVIICRKLGIYKQAKTLWKIFHR